MEAKLKAEELYLKYHNLWINGNSIIAKQCALIAVDEILKVLVDLCDGVFTFIYDVQYWDEVKQEIEKL